MKEFEWKEDREPHFQRRKDILKDHPEVRQLFGTDTSLKYKTVALIAIQLAIPFFILDLHWALQGLIIFFIGATISHALFLTIHEITHDLAFKNKVANNILAIFANIPIVLPYAMAFKIYHAEHHWFVGIPFYRLPAVRAYLREQGEFDATLLPSYVGRIRFLLQQAARRES